MFVSLVGYPAKPFETESERTRPERIFLSFRAYILFVIILIDFFGFYFGLQCNRQRQGEFPFTEISVLRKRMEIRIHGSDLLRRVLGEKLRGITLTLTRLVFPFYCSIAIHPNKLVVATGQVCGTDRRDAMVRLQREKVPDQTTT